MVWPYVQLQSGKEMAKQGRDGEPRGWRVDRDRGRCLLQPKSWGTSKELVGTHRIWEAKGRSCAQCAGSSPLQEGFGG